MTCETLALAEKLGHCLRQLGWRVGTAESCTGGLVAAAITDVAGSSAWFDEGLVTYANHSKIRLVQVPESMLAAHGAVSKAVVEQMALGVLARGADFALATSGVAGPDGGTPEKPVGSVWMAWASAGEVHSLLHCFSGDRMQIRNQAVLCLLESAVRYLDHKKTV